MAEHFDCCTYRLDAWLTGLVGFQLGSMRWARRQDGRAWKRARRIARASTSARTGSLENPRSPANKRSYRL